MDEDFSFSSKSSKNESRMGSLRSRSASMNSKKMNSMNSKKSSKSNKKLMIGTDDDDEGGNDVIAEGALSELKKKEHFRKNKTYLAIKRELEQRSRQRLKDQSEGLPQEQVYYVDKNRAGAVGQSFSVEYSYLHGESKKTLHFFLIQFLTAITRKRFVGIT